MTDGRSIPLTTFINTALWGLVLAVIIAGWICMIAGQHFVAQMLGFSACALSAVAATSTIRSYVARTQQLIRAAHGFDGPNGADLHTIP